MRDGAFHGESAACDGRRALKRAWTPAREVVAIFSIWGFGHLVLALLSLVVLVRYRSLVPLALLVLLVEQAGRKLILVALPIVKTGAPPGSMVNVALMATNAVALLLALWPSHSPGAAAGRR